MSVLVILGHGSSKHPDSSKSVRDHTKLLTDTGEFDEVRCAFLKEEPFIEHCLDGLEDEQVVIVPDFLAEGYFTRRVIPDQLGLVALPDNIRYCPPVGTHPMMARLITEAASRLLHDWKASDVSLLVIGHGSGKNPCSKQTLITHLHAIRETSVFGQVADLWLEEEAYVSSWQSVAENKQVIVVPFLLNDGQHGGWDIPADIGIPVGGEVHARTHVIGEHEVRIAEALGTSSRFADAIHALASLWMSGA